jgi:hypothetical protein
LKTPVLIALFLMPLYENQGHTFIEKGKSQRHSGLSGTLPLRWKRFRSSQTDEILRCVQNDKTKVFWLFVQDLREKGFCGFP